MKYQQVGATSKPEVTEMEKKSTFVPFFTSHIKKKFLNKAVFIVEKLIKTKKEGKNSLSASK